MMQPVMILTFSPLMHKRDVVKWRKFADRLVSHKEEPSLDNMHVPDNNKDK